MLASSCISFPDLHYLTPDLHYLIPDLHYLVPDLKYLFVSVISRPSNTLQVYHATVNLINLMAFTFRTQWARFLCGWFNKDNSSLALREFCNCLTGTLTLYTKKMLTGVCIIQCHEEL